jgi:hypothetical protein
MDLYTCINGSAVFGVIVLSVHLNDVNGVNKLKMIVMSFQSTRVDQCE